MKLPFIVCSALLVFATLSMAGGALAQSSQRQPADSSLVEPFPDMPADHWAYQAADVLDKAGFPIQGADGISLGRRLAARRDFAVGVSRVLWVVSAKGPGNPGLARVKAALQNRLVNDPQAFGALKTLVYEFEPELARLGCDIPAVKDRLRVLEVFVPYYEPRVRIEKPTNSNIPLYNPDTIFVVPRAEQFYFSR
ncbi:MAG TPA: hypothetical protein VFW40_13475 [Capsulimonadaceae bacterium]|nr:hypothetical protein [Capsulimonadaceae bacterium]